MPFPVTTVSPTGPRTGAATWPESPCLPLGTASPSGLLSGFCAAIKFAVRITNRQVERKLVFPRGSFMSFDLVCVMCARSVAVNDEQKKPRCYKPARAVTFLNDEFVVRLA